jgi:hypothetical protein
MLLTVMLLAADAARAYFIWGTGEQKCSDFVGAKIEYDHAGNSRDHLAHLNWIKGFITGINWAKDSDIARDLDIETVRAWVDAYCRENPLESIAHASEELVVALERRGGD